MSTERFTVEMGTVDTVDAMGLETRRRPRLSREWRRALILGGIVASIFLVALFSPVLTPHDPLKVSVRDRLKPPGYVSRDGGFFLLGTDGVGRDVLSRVIYGSRWSLFIALAAVALAASLGTLLGLVSGFVRGKTDGVLMRMADIWLAFPEILLALSLIAVLGTGLVTLVLALGLSRWVSYARLVRGSVLALREQEFVLAAEAVGVPVGRIMLRHILPNVLNIIVILAALHLGQMIILESALSFLGLGVQPPEASWGSMIGDGRVYLHNAWWTATFPGLAIATTVLLAGLFGDALRDALDPRYRSA